MRPRHAKILGQAAHRTAADGARVRRTHAHRPSCMQTSTRRILFWTPQLCERGTAVAVFEYADGAEKVLGMTSWIAYDALAWNNFSGMVARFRSRFGDRLIALEQGFDGVDALLAEHDIAFLHCLRQETVSPCRSRLPHVRVLLHYVFDGSDGNVGSSAADVRFARISSVVPGASPVVPHIVQPIIQSNDHAPDLRSELGIPADATVFGRHGAYETFDIGFVREAVVEIAASSPSIYFVFMHTAPFVQRPNVLHINRSCDPDRKAAFIRTCDAMIHGRSNGETFGLAVAEFSAANKPVITSAAHHDGGKARFHLDALAAHGTHCERLFYEDKASLLALLAGFDRAVMAMHDWRAHRSYEPEAVMATFASVFLSGKSSAPDSVPACAIVEAAADEERRVEAAWSACVQRDREMARLRALPEVEAQELRRPKRYLNVFKGAFVQVRLAPSLSAGSVDQLTRGATCLVTSVCGEWASVGPDRWVLTRHPLYGALLEVERSCAEDGARNDLEDV
jgi:hypothetical protein